jgi:sugar/nucleoside kinase (ribokinase family)
MRDVVLIGHVSRDVIRAGRSVRLSEGGAVHHAGIAYRRLGVTVEVVTKAAAADDALLDPLRRAGAVVERLPSAATTSFENTLSTDLEHRTQRLLGLADAFEPEEAPGLRAQAVHLGPLSQGEMSVRFLRHAGRTGAAVFLDAQGFIRRRDGEFVRQVRWSETEEALRFVDVLKVDETEARVLSGRERVEHAAEALAASGPREVVVTRGARGVLLVADGSVLEIPALPPRKLVDPTGAGDAFGAGYVYARILGRGSPESAARFAAALASLAIESPGAFGGTLAEVLARCDEYRA